MDMDSYFECMFQTKCIRLMKAIQCSCQQKMGLLASCLDFGVCLKPYCCKCCLWVGSSRLIHGFFLGIDLNMPQKCCGTLRFQSHFYFLTVCSDCFSFNGHTTVCACVCLYSFVYLDYSQRNLEQRAFMSVEFLRRSIMLKF